MFLVQFFVSFIYQPFLNILVFFYWIDGVITRGHPDMGIAVILLTIIIRILLLPMSLAEDKSEEERREMLHKLHEIERTYKTDPIAMRHESRKLFHRNRKVVAAEIFSFFVQVIIALMLWKIFSTGLEGQDVPLIYPFLPKVDLPFNLVFLHKFDLAHSNFFLNIMQSVMIFLVETTAILTSPYPPMKGEVVRLQLILPVVSFVVFLALPAGKKLFVITTLIISLILLLYKYVKRRIEDYKLQIEEREKAEKEAEIAKQVQGAGTTQYVKVGDQLYPVQQLPGLNSTSTTSQK